MMVVKKILDQSDSKLIGPNCPGVITVDEAKIGIMPGFICKKRKYCICFKIRNSNHEAIDQLVKNDLGQTTAIGIGGDPIIGTDMRQVLELFENDPETHGIVMIGEIGGLMEVEAAQWAEKCIKAYCWIYSRPNCSTGRRMGHAGAIVSGGDDATEAKMRALEESGISVCKSCI